MSQNHPTGERTYKGQILEREAQNADCRDRISSCLCRVLYAFGRVGIHQGGRQIAGRNDLTPVKSKRNSLELLIFSGFWMTFALQYPKMDVAYREIHSIFAMLSRNGWQTYLDESVSLFP